MEGASSMLLGKELELRKQASMASSSDAELRDKRINTVFIREMDMEFAPQTDFYFLDIPIPS